MRSMFVSYARGDHEFIKALAQDLTELDHIVWYDNELTGGQTWWDQVLLKIRECDLFVFGLSAESLESQACKLERSYARSLLKNILPILIADGVDVNLLPADLAEIHFVDYRRADKRSLISMLRALHRLPPVQQLPSPLPTPPPVPVSYLGNLKERVDAMQLSSEQQAELVFTLKRSLKDVRERSGAIALLRKLRERKDLLAWTGEEIEEILSSPLAQTDERAAVKTTPKPPQESAQISSETDAFTAAVRKWTKVFEVKSPVLDGEKGTAAVTEIFVAHGDKVRKEQKLLELEWDKAVTEVASPGDGVIQKIHVSTGDKVEQGGRLLVVESTDWAKVRAEIQALAERDDVNAQHSLAAMYHEGQGVGVDHAEAAKWNLKAAENGHKDAQYHVAVMFAFGRGVTKNKEQAVKWFSKAAAQGHANAQYNLALRYASGEGASQNEKEAVKWFQRAAKQGHTKAQDELKKRGIK